MAQEIQILGLSLDEAKVLIKEVLKECLEELRSATNEENERSMSVNETCRFLGISRPTLNKYVKHLGLRRHDLGRKKKVFYMSEILEDIKRIKTIEDAKYPAS